MKLTKHLNYHDDAKKLIYESYFLNEKGNKHGKEAYFSENGFLTDSYFFNNGKMTSQKLYYKNGRIKTHWVYKDYEVTKITCYSDDGDVSCKLLYQKNGLIVYKYFHHDGTLLNSKNYWAKAQGGLWEIIRHYKPKNMSTLSYIVKSKHYYKDTYLLEVKHFDETGELIITGTK